MSDETGQAIDQLGREPATCSLDAAAGASRRDRWLRLADRALTGKVATERGVRLSYQRSRGVEAELQELVALERACCGFADWTLEPSKRSLVLDVSADPAQASIVRRMFDVDAAAGGASR